MKNVSLFAALAFWGELFNPDFFVRVTAAFIAFCGISSAVYITNDIIDAPRDRLHPIKKNRPIASGKLDPTLAGIGALLLLLVFLPFALALERYFFFMALAYVGLQLLYSLRLRDVIILDAMAVAFGFIIRVYAGSAVVSISMSSWLALTTIGLALLLAFGKRRSERTLLETINGRRPTRQTLEHYPDILLDAMISMSASLCIITYSLFAFQTSPRRAISLFSPILPQSLLAPKWMMLTIPIVIYGVARYLYVIYEKKEGESPEKVLLSDRPLLSAVILWILAILVIIYGIGG